MVSNTSDVTSILKVEMNGFVVRFLGAIIKVQIAKGLGDESLSLKKYCESCSSGSENWPFE